jgi:hypothetical protein
MISIRSVELVIDTVVCLTLDKWETVTGQFGGYLTKQGVGTCCDTLEPCTKALASMYITLPKSSVLAREA